MLKGIGASLAGMKWEQSRSEVIANNAANLETDGFKRSVAVGSEFAVALMKRLGDMQGPQEQRAADVGLLGHGAELVQVVVDAKGGTLRATESPLDVALLGPGEFTFQGPSGLGYTRNGDFDRDVEGRLVTVVGHLVMVNGGPIGALGQTMSIQSDGTVLLDGKAAGRLDIRGGEGTKLATRTVEQSNVEMSQEMTDLITALRAFQVNQRAFQLQDQTLTRAVSDLGKV